MTATLKLISSMAPREVLAAAIAEFRSSHAANIQSEAGGGVDVARRVAAGEPVDIVVLSNDAIDKLANGGHVSAMTRVDLMDSGIAMAVPAGAAHPALSSEEDVRRAVAGAESLSYSTGPSGRYLEKLFEGWGILDGLRARIVVPPPGVPVARLLAAGQVKLGFQQFSELVSAPGIDVLGPLPAKIQHVTTFTGAVTPHCVDVETARRLLAYLASADLDSLRRQYGMESSKRGNAR